MAELRRSFAAALSLLIPFAVGIGQAEGSDWIPVKQDTRPGLEQSLRLSLQKLQAFSSPGDDQEALRALAKEADQLNADYRQRMSQYEAFQSVQSRYDTLAQRLQTAIDNRDNLSRRIEATAAAVDQVGKRIEQFHKDIADRQGELQSYLKEFHWGDILVASVYTRGLFDTDRTLNTFADTAAEIPLAQEKASMSGTARDRIVQQLGADYARSLSEGSMSWTGEQPMRIKIDASTHGTTFLRLKRFAYFPFRANTDGERKGRPSDRVKVRLIHSMADLDALLKEAGYQSGSLDLSAVRAAIDATEAFNGLQPTALGDTLEAHNHFIEDLKRSIRAAENEKEQLTGLLKTQKEKLTTFEQARQAAAQEFQGIQVQYEKEEGRMTKVDPNWEGVVVRAFHGEIDGLTSPFQAALRSVLDGSTWVHQEALRMYAQNGIEDGSGKRQVPELKIASLQLLSLMNDGDGVTTRVAFRVKEDKSHPTLPPPPPALNPKSDEAVSGTTDNPLVDVPEPNTKGKLTLYPEPDNAKIRVMNIVPRYVPGLELSCGRYDVEVSAEGFQTWRQWIRVCGADVSMRVKLIAAK